MNFRAIPLPWLVVAWGFAALVCLAGMLDRVSEWSPELATAYLVWLCVGLVGWFLVRDRQDVVAADETVRRPWAVLDTVLAVLIGGVALTACAATGAHIGDLPPAYHDEYSYLFGAQSVLAGRWTWPSHPTHPELFDQFHVLNEGMMASRYYPGTAAWIAPWLAMGHPYWGHWCAGAIAASLVYATGHELAGRRCALIAGLLFAAAMGPALFGNLLLAHHPTLLGLMLFLWAFSRARRTHDWRCDLLAGIGLSFAMLCRPATAAAFAFPFGAAWFWRQATALLRFDDRKREVSTSVAALGLPIVCGWGVMLAYNHAVTGDWKTSPYQLYTNLYTPRHVFGFNNVTRGEQRLGPKVLNDYDRWAENLTPELAWRNVENRFVSSALATIDLPLMTVVIALAVPVLRRSDRRWSLVGLAIVSMYAFHWFYWYVGIMGWHYVFETAPLWCLLSGRTADVLWRQWRAERRDLLPVWMCGMAALAWGGMYLDVDEAWPSRWRRSWEVIQHPRRQHAEFRRWITESTGTEPVLVLVDSSGSGTHLDYVINAPGLKDRVLVGRYRPGTTDLVAIARDFPERAVYYCRPDRHELRPVDE